MCILVGGVIGIASAGNFSVEIFGNVVDDCEGIITFLVLASFIAGVGGVGSVGGVGGVVEVVGLFGCCGIFAGLTVSRVVYSNRFVVGMVGFKVVNNFAIVFVVDVVNFFAVVVGAFDVVVTGNLVVVGKLVIVVNFTVVNIGLIDVVITFFVVDITGVVVVGTFVVVILGVVVVGLSVSVVVGFIVVKDDVATLYFSV